MKKLNISLILVIAVCSIFVFGFQLTNIAAQTENCVSPDAKLELTVSSLITGDNAYSLEDIRIQVSISDSFSEADRVESKLVSENTEVTPEGLKPLGDTFVIYVSGDAACQYNIRVIVVDSSGATTAEFEKVYMNPIIEQVEPGTVTLNVIGIPDETEEKVVTVTVGGQNLDTFKYRINNGSWVIGLKPGAHDITFNYGLNSIEVIGVGTEGQESDTYSKTFEVLVPTDGIIYPVYLGGYGYDVILNYYYWLAINHYLKSVEYQEAGMEEEAFEAERYAYAFYDWAQKVEDRIGRDFDYELPTTGEIETVTINNREFPYTFPVYYKLLPMLEHLIDTYLRAGYTAKYEGKINDAIKYFDIVILLDPYNVYALEELNSLNSTYIPSYKSIFSEEVDPRFIND